jgi:hypothetical protein
MVTIYDKDGKPLYRQPPYTWEEEQALYKGMSAGPVTVLRTHRPGDPLPPEPEPEAEGPKQEEEPRS